MIATDIYVCGQRLYIDYDESDSSITPEETVEIFHEEFQRMRDLAYSSKSIAMRAKGRVAAMKEGVPV